MTLDSDNEFGYDFSAEEEELLLQLSAEKNNTAHPNNTKIAVIDSVPERRNNLHPQNVTGATSTDGVDRLQTESTNSLYRGKAFHQLDASSGLPTPPPAVSSIEDVLYPDCT
jgi:exonuclease V